MMSSAVAAVVSAAVLTAAAGGEPEPPAAAQPPSVSLGASPMPPERERAPASPYGGQPEWSPGLAAAADLAFAAGYTAGVAVLDTVTGRIRSAGDSGEFAAESVVKALIATRILLEGGMAGDVAETAFRMVSQSDDDAADELYGLAGADGVLPWVAEHYGIDDLGSPPWRPYWWGSTQITAVGMARFYAAVRADPLVWPWLSAAMHAAEPYGADGTYQLFGLGEASNGSAAIKQGWGNDSRAGTGFCSFNSTGLVDGDRFAVAILVQGPISQYGSGCPQMATSIAAALMPNGVMAP